MSPKVILFILSASFAIPHSTHSVLLSESTKRCLESMKNYFLDSSHVIANDSALTLRLRPKVSWVPC